MISDMSQWLCDALHHNPMDKRKAAMTNLFWRRLWLLPVV